ncbi:S8 family peptidase [Paenibacillus sp.]|uniref:S8 family peptidase n=1 Tax=Paenibacillus sp. TaxID=58172 RepID=UPI002D5DCB29|nr:S8 family peptidase [Paenibacillus sp.]HZG55878.1 S8 family peptidase [Paenibacillus sp.]
MGKRTLPIGWIAGLAALALPVGFFLSRGEEPAVPGADAGAAERGAMQSASAEQLRKLSIVANDVSVTEELCRLQCRDDLASLAERLKNNERAARSALKEMRKAHPHFHALAYVGQDGKKRTVGRGAPSDDAVPGAAAAWRDAVRSVGMGRAYQSRALIGRDGDTYFVLGETGGKGRGGVVGLVHQDVLRRVANHQARNLRLREFPDEDKRFGIRAVDPNTGREVDVDSPEENEGISHYRKREVVVRFAEPPTKEQVERMRTETGAVSVKQLGYAFVFDSATMSTPELLDYFRTKNVVYAEPHYMYVTNGAAEPAAELVPNDELYRRYQWNLPIIGTPAGWSFSKGAEEVIVAVIDTGVTLGHPDLAGHLVEGYNVVAPDRPPDDDVGHGTHVAGVVSALTDNGQGVAGMTWYNKVMPVKVLDSTGMGSTYSVAEGIVWATDHGAKVINLSLGNYASAEFLHDAIRYAYDRDVVLIAATGNDNTDQPGFPAAYPEVFAVSATNQAKERASFSNYGDYIDVVAPGENIASTYTENQYAALSGTSMASPHVAALAALIRSVNPELKNTEVYDVMRRSAVDLGPAGRDPYFGYGQIDVARALQLASGKAPQEAAADGEAERTVGGGSFLERLLHALLGM